ncbi:MAG: type I-E CRISPR-associated protein Cas6/Cse3/CasE [Deferrisomatales bacterium]
MFLHRLHLDPRCREARRDLADPYQLHSTLCRAFSEPERKCPPNEFLWRLEPELDPAGCPRILVQSRSLPNWKRIDSPGWLASADPPVDVRARLKLDALTAGTRFRFRLRANPCVTRNGKRLGLLRPEEQEAWLARQGERHGFSVPKLAAFDLAGLSQGRIDVRICQEQMLRGRQHEGNGIRIFSVLYDGFLAVTEPRCFGDAVRTGIGHGKAMGLGLLSVVPTG